MHPSSSASPMFIGLMSGTSMDGVDAVLAQSEQDTWRVIDSAFLPFPADLRRELMSLQAASADELQREALAANALVRVYADCIAKLLKQAGLTANAVRAVGAHGQTIRHRPDLGYTWQTNNPALLAEYCGIDVVADFRRRDVAAGGQGAPLVPAFHHSAFGIPAQHRVIANIGGISNISILPTGVNPTVSGFDTGPGNVLMDGWISRHRGLDYDANGAWAASGKVIPTLLQALLQDPYFARAAPKSTGRDLFHLDWLAPHLLAHANADAADVQATLLAFTATSLAEAISTYAPETQAVYVCGGGAYNTALMQSLETQLQKVLKHRTPDTPDTALVQSSAALGISPSHVEALAFAWLAAQFLQRAPGNLPAVTGAHGPRILGGLYPA